MHKKPLRIKKIENALYKTIMLVINNNIRDQRIKWVNITNINISKDLSSAKIFFNCLTNNDVSQLTQQLKKANTFFKHKISETLNLRKIPKLHFIYDNSLNNYYKMDNIINNI